MGALVTILTVFAVVAAAVYQLYVSPLMTLLGVGRTVEVFGHSDRCYTVPEVPGCESARSFLKVHHLSHARQNPYYTTPRVHSTCHAPPSRNVLYG